MNRKNIQLAAYLLIMAVMITGALYLARKKHGVCSVCNHSIVTEGWSEVTDTAPKFIQIPY